VTGENSTNWINVELKHLKKADRKTLRNFGLVMAIPLLLIAAYLLWKGRASAPYLLAVSALFALLGLILPKVLKPVYIGWMTFANYLSIVVTYIVLTLFFFIVLTPVSLVIKILGKDLLLQRLDPDASSYWVDANSYEDDINRYTKPF